MHQRKKRLFKAAAGIALAALALLPVQTALPQSRVARAPASMALTAARNVNLEDPRSVFAHVFAQLPDSVLILPTENYEYFQFSAGTKRIWGNLRLARQDRDNGVLHLGYYEYKPDMSTPEEANAQHKAFDAKDGVEVVKLDDFHYDVTALGKTVHFALNQLSQAAPRKWKIPDDEEMLFRLQDESNVRFVLMYSKASNSFYYVADEDDQPLDLQDAGGSLGLEPESRFLFYLDAANGSRKILVGAHNDNIRRNTYYDGPFDQLADNYIGADSRFTELLAKVYPGVAGRIDRFGFFRDEPEARVGILAYHSYMSVEDVASVVSSCQAYRGRGEFYGCLTRDGQGSEATADAGCTAAASAQAANDPPCGTPHDTYVTYVHRTNITWIPPGTRHTAGTSYVHFTGLTWIPPLTPHDSLITYIHHTNVTWIPPGTRHDAGSTYVHRTGVSWIPPGTPHETYVTYAHHAGLSWIPPGTRHDAGTSYVHRTGVSWVPPTAKHTTYVTYAHRTGVSWP